MSLLYIQPQPLSRLGLPTESNQSKPEFEPIEHQAPVHHSLNLSKEVWQIKQTYHLERRLFL